MIHLADGGTVAALLRRALLHPERYRSILLCTPFIDKSSLNLLSALASKASKAGTALSLVTTPETATALRRNMPLDLQNAFAIHTRRRLHAKLYVLEGRIPADSEAIVTSANLTRPGLQRNLELGVSATLDTNAGSLLFYDVIRQLRCQRGARQLPGRVR